MDDHTDDLARTDEPDPVVDAETVWAWQADAKDAIKAAALALTPAPEAPKGGEGGGSMWTGMGPNSPAPRLDPNCQCICHTQPGVMHVAACCSTPASEGQE